MNKVITIECYLDTSRDLINPSWVSWARVSVSDPKHLMNPGYNTEDVSRCIAST